MRKLILLALIGILHLVAWEVNFMVVEWQNAPERRPGESLEVWCTIEDTDGVAHSFDLHPFVYDSGSVSFITRESFVGESWRVVACVGYHLDIDGEVINESEIARGWTAIFPWIKTFLPLMNWR